LHVKGKRSQITLSRIQALESLAFGWKPTITYWEERLSALAEYRKIHGHCNVPQDYSKNTTLAHWVSNQRTNFSLHLEGKTSKMTLDRIQALEGLGFEWRLSGQGKGTRQNPSLDDDTRCADRKQANSRQGGSSRLETAPSNVILTATGYY
jgi:hypothetical protein